MTRLPLLIAFVAALLSPQHLGIFTSPTSTSAVLQESDINYLGVFQMPASGTYEGNNAASNLVTGRTVGGVVHIFLTGPNNGNAGTNSTVASASSTTVFTLSSGQGAAYSNGDRVYVVRAAAAAGSLPDETVISGISTDTLTVSPALGGIPAASDTVYKWGDQVFEVADPGPPYNTTYTSAPRATLVQNWGDTYHANRTSWVQTGGSAGTVNLNPAYTNPTSMYFDEAASSSGNGYLYETYYNYYNVSNVNYWGLSAATLTTGGASTGYGPWMTQATDPYLGNTHYGAGMCSFSYLNPADGSMMCGGATNQSGSTNESWGPEDWGGHAWPTSGTSSGYSASNLTFGNEYLRYYYAGENLTNLGKGNYINSVGGVTGVLVSMDRLTTDLSLFEDQAVMANGIDETVSPAQYGGHGSWVLDDTVSNCTWLPLVHKRAMVCSVTLAGGPSQTTTDCINGGHSWYRSSGHGWITVTGAGWTGGAPSPNDLLTGATSGFSVQYDSTNTLSGTTRYYWECYTTCTPDFSSGETINDVTSGSHAVEASFYRQDTCNHGCGVLNWGGTGPINTAAFSGLIVFDPNDLIAVKNGSKTDYTVVPTSIINFNDFGIPLQAGGTGTQGTFTYAFPSAVVGYFDSVGDNMYVRLTGVDTTTNFGQTHSVIAVFHINDSAAPIPLPYELMDLAKRLHLTTGHP